MIRLLYISTARHPLASGELDDILRLSRRNNAAIGITGLLIAGGRRFLQALEGPEETVIATYERIRQDPRHFAVVELVREPIAERAFAGWTMGHRDGGVPTNDVDPVAALIAPIAEPHLRGYFAGFAQARAA